MPIEGSWAWSASAGGSEATFFERERRAANDDPLHALEPADRADQDGGRGVPDDVGVDQLADAEACPRPTIRRREPVTAELGAYDPLLDAIASSRGRIGFSTSASPRSSCRRGRKSAG